MAGYYLFSKHGDSDASDTAVVERDYLPDEPKGRPMKLEERPDFKLLNKKQQAALLSLVEKSAGGPEGVDFSADLTNGRLLFLSGEFGGAQTSPEQTALDFLEANAAPFGLERGLAGLGKAVVTKMESGFEVRIPQLVGEIRV